MLLHNGQQQDLTTAGDVSSRTPRYVVSVAPSVMGPDMQKAHENGFDNML
jgi:hypothetical protein